MSCSEFREVTPEGGCWVAAGETVSALSPCAGAEARPEGSWGRSKARSGSKCGSAGSSIEGREGGGRLVQERVRGVHWRVFVQKIRLKMLEKVVLGSGRKEMWSWARDWGVP